MINTRITTLPCFLQNRFLTTTKAKTLATVDLCQSSSSYTVQFLNNSCGLPLESALKASLKLQLKETNSKKHESVLTFLKSHGFSDTHIAKLIQKYPKILHSKVDVTIKPKIEFFLQKGFVGSLLPQLIVSNPAVLGRSLSLHLEPSHAFLKMYLETDERVVAAVKRGTWLFSSNKETMQPNIDVLISEGIPISHISKFILFQPRILSQKADRVVKAIRKVQNMGLESATSRFMNAVWVMASMSDSYWNKKLDLFRSFGWSEEDIMSVFKSNPLCLACSDDKIKSAMDFFLNTMKLESSDIVSYPAILLYALETRIRPRYKVMKLLESKELVKKDKKIVWVITISEKNFLEKYVTKHLDQVPDLMEIYHGTYMASSRD